jgi:hypothetical protein
LASQRVRTGFSDASPADQAPIGLLFPRGSGSGSGDYWEDTIGQRLILVDAPVMRRGLELPPLVVSA